MGFAEDLVEFALSGKFEDQEHSFRIMEMAEKTEDIGMAEVRLDFNFAAELFLDAALGEFLFEENL